MIYTVSITTRLGQFVTVFRTYNEVEEFVRTAVLHSQEPNATVIISAKRDEAWEEIMKNVKKDEEK